MTNAKKTQNTTATPTTPRAASERVKLERPHTQGRTLHPAGASITVPADTAEWLRRQGVVAPKANTETNPPTED